ncbi:uncharacterized protein LOC142550678 [Primulina tabacum]|uniref:uncharacterized protein LOC142550678 n=1 Tax=Primulina tabacum TaxID=48773 RepID=UPI003F5A0303
MVLYRRKRSKAGVINDSLPEEKRLPTMVCEYIEKECVNFWWGLDKAGEMTGECDSLFWRFDDKGNYMVRDGCRLQRGLFSLPEHQLEHPIKSWWAFIWSLSVPPKSARGASGKKNKILSMEIGATQWLTIFFGVTMLCDFRRARKKEKIAIQDELVNPKKKWMPPGSCNLKMNVDASVNKDKNHYSVGGVVRDSQGRLLLAFEKQINQPISVVHGEILAIWEGSKLLYEKYL